MQVGSFNYLLTVVKSPAGKIHVYEEHYNRLKTLNIKGKFITEAEL